MTGSASILPRRGEACRGVSEDNEACVDEVFELAVRKKVVGDAIGVPEAEGDVLRGRARVVIDLFEFPRRRIIPQRATARCSSQYP